MLYLPTCFLTNTMSINQGKRRKGTKEMIENRNVNIITDADGKKLVLINNIRFKGKRQIDWDDVKQYLEGYVGDYYEIAENGRKYLYDILAIKKETSKP